jgi:hypothetical protein
MMSMGMTRWVVEVAVWIELRRREDEVVCSCRRER